MRYAPGRAWNAGTGEGHVAAVKGKYDRAAGHGVELAALLIETSGGWSPGLVDLVQRATVERGNKLQRLEYDEATWSTRTWSTFAVQRVSCAATRAIAHAVARELELTTVRDPRPTSESARARRRAAEDREDA